jgi:hypothetical protein
MGAGAILRRRDELRAEDEPDSRSVCRKPPAENKLSRLAPFMRIGMRGSPSWQRHKRRHAGYVCADCSNYPSLRLQGGRPYVCADAHRCAFTAELSTKTCAGGPPAVASAWNMSTPYALRCPADEAIVECFARTIDLRRIDPARAHRTSAPG